MDNFREEIVVKQNRIANDILHALLSVVMVLSALMAAMALASFTMSENLIAQVIQLLLFGGIAF